MNYEDDGTCVASPYLCALMAGSSDMNFKSVKEYLVPAVQSVLPTRMGTKYAKVVETCLTCLDDGNADFGDEQEFQDADGVLVGVRYIEKVIVCFELCLLSPFANIRRCF